MYIKNKIRNLIFLLVGLIAMPVFSYANTDTFPAFSISGYLQGNGNLIVAEEFIFDFGVDPRHGLIRSIPLVSANGKRWYELTNISVKNKDKNDILFEPTTTGNIAKVKIGDKNITVTGTQYYNLNYSISNIANNTELNWTILKPTREPIGKFQARLRFPNFIPLDTATATCSFIPARQDGGCNATPIVESGKLVGFVIDINGIDKEEIFLNVKYPNGIVKSNYIEDDNQIPYRKIIIISTIILISSLLLFCIYYFRNKIKILFKEILKHPISPDTYSYLERAMYYNKKISKEDIIATIIDLEERGYLTLEQFAQPVGVNEFIDYSIEVQSSEIDNLAEKCLIDSLGDKTSSLSEWLNNNFDKISNELETLSLEGIKEVKLLKNEEEIPRLIGFKII